MKEELFGNLGVAHTTSSGSQACQAVRVGFDQTAARETLSHPGTLRASGIGSIIRRAPGPAPRTV